MLGTFTVLGDYTVAFIKKVCGNIGRVSCNTIDRVVNIGLELTAPNFPQVVCRYEERAIEKSALAVKRWHTRQSDTDISVQSRAASVGKKVGIGYRNVFAGVVCPKCSYVLKSRHSRHCKQLTVPHKTFRLPRPATSDTAMETPRCFSLIFQF